MAITEYQSILKIRNYSGYPAGQDAPLTLEQAIREDFGEKGLTRFQDYNVQVDAPISTNFVLPFTRPGEVIESGSKVVGKVYFFSTEGIRHVSAQGANTEVKKTGVSLQLRLELDLNPEQEVRYLRMVFPFLSEPYHPPSIDGGIIRGCF